MGAEPLVVQGLVLRLPGALGEDVGPSVARPVLSAPLAGDPTRLGGVPRGVVMDAPPGEAGDRLNMVRVGVPAVVLDARVVGRAPIAWVGGRARGGGREGAVGGPFQRERFLPSKETDLYPVGGSEKTGPFFYT